MNHMYKITKVYATDGLPFNLMSFWGWGPPLRTKPFPGPPFHVLHCSSRNFFGLPSATSTGQTCFFTNMNVLKGKPTISRRSIKYH